MIVYFEVVLKSQEITTIHEETSEITNITIHEEILRFPFQMCYSETPAPTQRRSCKVSSHCQREETLQETSGVNEANSTFTPGSSFSPPEDCSSRQPLVEEECRRTFTRVLVEQTIRSR